MNTTTFNKEVLSAINELMIDAMNNGLEGQYVRLEDDAAFIRLCQLLKTRYNHLLVTADKAHH